MINRKKLYLKAIIFLFMLFFATGCECPAPCVGNAVDPAVKAILYLLLTQSPAFSGSCVLQNDCIQFENATNESTHLSICNFQGGQYKHNVSCDLSAKSAQCSLLKETSIFRLKYFYGSFWGNTESAEHCETNLKGIYSTL